MIRKRCLVLLGAQKNSLLQKKLSVQRFCFLRQTRKAGRTPPPFLGCLLLRSWRVSRPFTRKISIVDAFHTECIYGSSRYSFPFLRQAVLARMSRNSSSQRREKGAFVFCCFVLKPSWFRFIYDSRRSAIRSQIGRTWSWHP